MNIHGQEFAFSLLNANDLDRLEDAIDEMSRESEAENERCERENVRLGDRLRAQARISMRGLDKILGAGTSARLGLNENDASLIYDIVDEIVQAAAAEKQRRTRPTLPAPQNRAQRRAEAKHKFQRLPGAADGIAYVDASSGKVVTVVSPSQRAKPVDKDARRKQLLAELSALEND